LEKGKLIVLEGIDGAGTTTQARLLYGALGKKQFVVECTAEPSEGPVGKLIRSYLKGEHPLDDAHLRGPGLALLFAADRLDHLAREVNPWREQGKVVISDRYLLSSLAYQSLDCELKWVMEINREAPRPDLTILLDLPAETALKRVSERQLWPELFEQADLQRRVRQNYLKLARELFSDQRILVLDSTKSIKETAQRILKEFLGYLG
jgi:dTMP kinase